MTDVIARKIESDPRYQALKSKRNKLGWTLAIMMWIVYYGYVALIAFDKELLARPTGDGVMTLGIPLGMGVIVFTVAIIAYYVRRANREFDGLTQQILAGVKQ